MTTLSKAQPVVTLGGPVTVVYSETFASDIITAKVADYYKLDPEFHNDVHFGQVIGVRLHLSTLDGSMIKTGIDSVGRPERSQPSRLLERSPAEPVQIACAQFIYALQPRHALLVGRLITNVRVIGSPDEALATERVEQPADVIMNVLAGIDLLEAMLDL